MNKSPKAKAGELLKKLGLNDLEATVYLAGLPHGSLSINSLAKICNIKRTNAYNVARSLVESGLCTYQSTSYGRKLRFEPFIGVVDLINKKQTELKEIAKDATALSSMLATHTTSRILAQPKVEFFQGTESVQKLFSKSIIGGTHNAVYSILSESGIFDVLGRGFISGYFRRRSEKGITSYSLRPYRERKTTDPSIGTSDEFKREVRFLPKDIVVDTTILLWDDKYVAFITTHEEPFGTLITSSDIYQTLKSFFDVSWRSGTK